MDFKGFKGQSGSPDITNRT